MNSRRFLLRAWSTAFLVCILVHCSYIGLDLITGNFIPETNHDPPIRLLMFALSGFAHAMSSAQVAPPSFKERKYLHELMLSIERAICCSFPERYHNQRLAKKKLLVAESLSVLIAMLYLWQISSDNIAIACCITNTLDFASLACLSCTTCYVMKRRKSLFNSSLNEKYQIKEALDITRVMLPCCVLSLILKMSASLAAWIYALDLIDSKYMFTITGSSYFCIESLNCMICSSLVLLKHAGLRRITERLICSKEETRVREKQSPGIIQEIYFDALSKDWK